MTALYPHRDGYGQNLAATRSPRAIEYDVFARVTRALADTDRDAAFPTYAAALHDNLKLWTALAADLALEGNPLPADLKARLFYLYEFTAQHTPKALRKEVGVAVLVDLNTAVMRGLRGEG
ncbi:flagellar biosynthesis regulator FlaF [Falsirhodobacter halotolerans]|uniref:flagellar biosynthesis regulator FlaF n=1 Tax=Falsirhodobacter halotolerans TaxID=1146892 RepID=UPI001FD5986F|nr:flagellar biosynthesis regulator FlaF [Falsirhodobacter halotolerans]MCJ8140569.1 flagellar biosynthesis regulator FlaF [Falsirhodobacter halotolerans]